MIKNYINVLKAIISECKNWPQIILTKIFGFKLNTIILKDDTKIFVGGKIGKADLSMFAEIWHEKYYNPSGFEIKENDTIFDIGANNGFFSIFAAGKAKYGKVYAFEPVPYLAEKINKTTNINNLKNIKVENIAVGDNNEKRIFYISKSHNGCHSLYKRCGETEKIEISITTLEKYCKDNNIQKIDFLKLDCEGAEYEIITKENINFIKNTIRLISMEYHDDINSHTHEEIVKLLEDANFSVEVSNGYIYAKNGNK